MRINLFGGPGAGKTTTSSFAFGAMKDDGRSVELAREFIKTWAYQKREVKPMDQITIFGRQFEEEYQYLSNGVKNVVTDSPVFLSYVYGKKYVPHLNMHPHILGLVQAYNAEHESLNIFLDRGNKAYDPMGRWQSPEEAIELDKMIRRELEECGIPFVSFPFENREEIIKYILDKTK